MKVQDLAFEIWKEESSLLIIAAFALLDSNKFRSLSEDEQDRLLLLKYQSIKNKKVTKTERKKLNNYQVKVLSNTIKNLYTLYKDNKLIYTPISKYSVKDCNYFLK